MKPVLFVICLALSILLMSPAHSVTLTFDDVPSTFQNLPPEFILGAYYGSLYGTGSTWGPPHSGSKVLAWTEVFPTNRSGMMFKRDKPLFAYSVGGYFSTEPGVVLEMVGYYMSLDNPVASVLIGGPGQSWNNVYVQIDSAAGQIGMVEFWSVTSDALSHFCADDIAVTFVPEPSAFLALGMGGMGLLGTALRRRRRSR